MDTDERPKVGIAVIIIKGQKVLLGKRKGNLGKDTWGFAGGHLEFKESWEDCSIRETKEEAGITIKNVRFAAVRNTIFSIENKHYVTVFMSADYESGEPTVLEPDKFECWGWFDWDHLPEPLFPTIYSLLETGFRP